MIVGNFFVYSCASFVWLWLPNSHAVFFNFFFLRIIKFEIVEKTSRALFLHNSPRFELNSKYVFRKQNELTRVHARKKKYFAVFALFKLFLKKIFFRIPYNFELIFLVLTKTRFLSSKQSNKIFQICSKFCFLLFF
jgi:hypothetical protein